MQLCIKYYFTIEHQCCFAINQQQTGADWATVWTSERNITQNHLVHIVPAIKQSLHKYNLDEFESE